jgi:putative FmdB family regulatory protein
MPTYEYKCQACGLRFDRHQPIKDAPLTECPECKGTVQRVVSGGTGVIMKSHTPSFRNLQNPSPQEMGTSSCAYSDSCGSADSCGKSKGGS